MRIGIDVTSALTQGGGIGRYTRELIQAVVAANFNPTVSFCLFSARPPAVTPVADPLPRGRSVDFRPAPLSEKWLYRLWYRLRLPIPVQVTTGKIDLFHSPDFVLPPVAGRIPTLLTVHDLSFIHFPEAFTPALVNYLNSVVPRSVAAATHILADSRSTRRDLVDQWQVPEEKITVLYSGVDPRFRPETDPRRLADLRVRYALGERPYVLAVGTIQPRKNYRMLIQAFAPVAHKMPYNLVIAGGKGWLYDDILAEVSRLGLEGRVLFTGFVADDDLPTLYSAATLFVFPSLYEGFGLPLLEAMACGVPVIHADTSSLPEVADGATVALPPNQPKAWTEAITWLLDDPVRRAQLVAAGFNQARRFTWQKSARQLLDIYSQFAG